MRPAQRDLPGRQPGVFEVSPVSSTPDTDLPLTRRVDAFDAVNHPQPDDRHPQGFLPPPTDRA